MTLYVENLYCPYYLQISGIFPDLTLITTSSFKQGSVIYKICGQMIRQNQTVIYKFGSSYRTCNISQTIDKGDYRLFTYFHMFASKSNTPNVIIQFDDSDNFRVIALRDISSYEALTV